jgi:hypothetical protein
MQLISIYRGTCPDFTSVEPREKHKQFKNKFRLFNHSKSGLHLSLSMKKSNKNLTTLNEFKVKNYGKPGTKERNELEAGYQNFKIGAHLYNSGLYKEKPDLKLLSKNEN